jgi:hypothetical protein
VSTPYVGGEPGQIPRDVVAVMAATGRKPGGPAVPPRWNVNFAFDDADVIAARAADLGGKVLIGPMDTPGFRSAGLIDQVADRRCAGAATQPRWLGPHITGSPHEVRWQRRVAYEGWSTSARHGANATPSGPTLSRWSAMTFQDQSKRPSCTRCIGVR